MIPHEETPEGDDLGGYDPGEVDPVSESLKTLEGRLTKIVKHAHLEQGLLAIDLVSALHGVLGKVISWGMVEALEGDDEDSEDEPEVEPKGPTDDGVITPDWTPASDATSEDDEPDVDDQGDPRMRV